MFETNKKYLTEIISFENSRPVFFEFTSIEKVDEEPIEKDAPPILKIKTNPNVFEELIDQTEFVFYSEDKKYVGYVDEWDGEIFITDYYDMELDDWDINEIKELISKILLKIKMIDKCPVSIGDEKNIEIPKEFQKFVEMIKQ
jgi:hypothetical protein